MWLRCRISRKESFLSLGWELIWGVLQLVCPPFFVPVLYKRMILMSSLQSRVVQRSFGPPPRSCDLLDLVFKRLSITTSNEASSGKLRKAILANSVGGYRGGGCGPPKKKRFCMTPTLLTVLWAWDSAPSSWIFWSTPDQDETPVRRTSSLFSSSG